MAWNGSAFPSAECEHFGEVGELGDRDGGLPFRLDVEDDGRGDGVVRMFGIDLMGEFLGGQSRELPVPAQQLSARGRFGGG